MATTGLVFRDTGYVDDRLTEMHDRRRRTPATQTSTRRRGTTDMSSRSEDGVPLTWRDSPLQDEHPVADQHSAEEIGELRRRIIAHSDSLSSNEHARFLAERGDPQTYDELRGMTQDFLVDRCSNSPIFQPNDVYETASGGPWGRRYATGGS